VGYAQRLRTQRSADVRVLKAQLDFIAEVVQASRYSAPILSALLAGVIGSGLFHVGSVSLAQAIAFPIIVVFSTVMAEIAVSTYRRETRIKPDYDTVNPWYQRFVTMQAVISGVWGLAPWLLWVPGSPLNHAFLALVIAWVAGALVVSRANHMDMFLASLAPISAIASVRYLFGDGAFDYFVGFLIPVAASQVYLYGGRLTRRLDEDTRLRFQVEDLARELEETRDDALRKRFEAETANASKTAFLANMSHELRTPLNAILGFSEIIAQECFGPVGADRYKEYATDIHSSGSHLLSLINDLLDVAKIEAGKMEIEPHLLEPRKTLEMALKIIGTKAREKRQQLVIEVDSNTPMLFADERALKQILINMVSNAVKFTPEGGRIAVVASRARSGDFQLMVEDNGPGIPPEKLDKIFTPFSQVDNRYDRQAGGTGLGLALVRGLAELHGGRAWLESEFGKGAKAFVVLPIQPAGAMSPETEAAA
jgi:two-component system cell cycle sensor histidine kinase PleC